MIGIRLVAGVATIGAAMMPVGVRPPAAPSQEGRAALAALTTPSHPTALPDSSVETAGSYRAITDCAGVRAAYSAADAPVPAGSTVGVDAYGVVQVTSPFSQSAIIGDDSGGTCEYVIATAPTVSISGGPAEPVSGFSAVSCTSLLGLSLFVGEVDLGGVRQVVFASPNGDGGGPDEWRAGVAPGTIAQLFSTPSDEVQPTLMITGAATPTSNSITVTGADGTSVRLVCTPAPPFDAAVPA